MQLRWQCSSSQIDIVIAGCGGSTLSCARPGRRIVLVRLYSLCGLILSSLLPCKSFVEQGKNFGDIELHIFQVKVVLAILLHFEQVVEFQV